MQNLALVSWANLSAFFGDFLSLIILVGIIAAYGFYLGKEKVVSLVLALYAGTLAYLHFPYMKSLTVSFGKVSSKFLLFVAFVAVFHIVFNKFISPSFSVSKAKDWGGLAVMSILAGAVIVVILYHILPFSGMYSLTLAISSLFASQDAVFYTLVAPVVALFFIYRS
jgi:hypothetical protein